MKGFTLIGRNANYVHFAQGQPYLSPNRADWVAPEFSPSGAAGGVNRYAPMAGITGDVFCGPPTTPAYPTQAAPSWTGFTTQYNRGGGSSDIKFKDLSISGFGVDIINGLNCPGNGDFWGFENIELLDSAYGIAIDNTQSRNVSVNNITANTLNSILTEQLPTLIFGRSFRVFRPGCRGLSERGLRPLALLYRRLCAHPLRLGRPTWRGSRL